MLKGSEERGYEIKKKEREEGMKSEMNRDEAGKKKGRGGETSIKMGDMEKIQGRDGKGRRM